MSPAIVIEGVRVETIGAYGEESWEADADGGCGPIEWSMQLPPSFSHPLLVPGKKVQVFAGAGAICSGILAQPKVNVDEDGQPTWSFTARAPKTAGRNTLALDGDGNTSAQPYTAVGAAIDRGLKWVNLPITDVITDWPTFDSAFNNTATGADQTDGLNALSDLLDAWATSVSARWGIDPDFRVRVAADPTTPDYVMTPGSGRFGLADDDYASAVFVRYLTSKGTYATATADNEVTGDAYGLREYGFDATSYGVLSSAQATGLAKGALAAGRERLGWTNPVTPNRWQLTTPGGTPVPWWMVKPQQMVRLFGVLDAQGQPLPYVDFVIGHCAYSAASETTTLTPVGAPPRTVKAWMAKQIGLAS